MTKLLLKLSFAQKDYKDAGGIDEAIFNFPNPRALKKAFDKDFSQYDHQLILRQQYGLQLVSGNKKFLLGIHILAYVQFGFESGGYTVSPTSVKNGKMLAKEIKDYLNTLYGRTPSNPVQVSPQIADLIQQGRKMEAIRLYREETGAGLAEARDTIDAVFG